jgi:hypothetical protein
MLQHEINLVSLMNQLEDWGFCASLEYKTDVILASLPPSYSGFIACYLMLGVNEPMKKLFHMLKAVAFWTVMVGAIIPSYTPDSPKKGIRVIRNYWLNSFRSIFLSPKYVIQIKCVRLDAGTRQEDEDWGEVKCWTHWT